MQLLSEDDLNLRGMSDAELDAAWELWFRLMQHTNDADPLYTHGVFAYVTAEELGIAREPGATTSGSATSTPS